MQRGLAQISAPVLAFDEYDPVAKDNAVRVSLSNLGLAVRPDLVDGHTIHWHGFVNAIPLFDGVPELSISVPIGRSFTYYYRPQDAGTYMYHCHFEDVEHVQMGMTGVRVRPAAAEQAPGERGSRGNEVRLQRRRRLHQVRPGVRLHAHRAVGGGPLPRRAHPDLGLDRLPAQLLADERPRLPGHPAGVHQPFDPP